MANKKMSYVEPSGYFTPSMKKILEAGEKSAKKTGKTTATKTTTKKSTKK